MNITVDPEFIATQDYKDMLCMELAIRDIAIQRLIIRFNKNPSEFNKELLNNMITVFNSELKHYKELFKAEE